MFTDNKSVFDFKLCNILIPGSHSKSTDGCYGINKVNPKSFSVKAYN